MKKEKKKKTEKPIESTMRRDIPEPYYTRQRDGLADMGKSVMKGAHWLTTISLVITSAILLTHMQNGQQAQAELKNLKKQIIAVKEKQDEKPIEKPAVTKTILKIKKVEKIRPIRLHLSAIRQAEHQCNYQLNYILVVDSTGKWTVKCK